jgi:hypothetical protein
MANMTHLLRSARIHFFLSIFLFFYALVYAPSPVNTILVVGSIAYGAVVWSLFMRQLWKSRHQKETQEELTAESRPQHLAEAIASQEKQRALRHAYPKN